MWRNFGRNVELFETYVILRYLEHFETFFIMTDLNTHVVAKSNRLVEAGYRLTMREQQLVLFACHRVQYSGKGLDPLSQCVIDVNDFAEFFGLDNSHSIYDELRECIDGLFKREVTIYDTHPETGERLVITSRWIDTKVRSHDSQYLAIRFAHEVRPYLTNLSGQFTKYDLKQVSAFTSVYAVRLYELLKQYFSIGSREITVADLRNMFQLQGKYSLFSDFRKNVLEPAVKQINQLTDLRVSYVTKRSKRQISSIHFKIGKARAKPVQPRLFSSKVLTEVTPLNPTAQATLEASLAAIQAKADAAKAVS